MNDVPTWIEQGDLPLPDGARSVVIKPPKEPASAQSGPALFAGPGLVSQRRGTAAFGAILPLFGAKRGGECLGRWLLVGPLSWICSDAVEVLPLPAPPRDDNAAPPYRYFFVGPNGAEGFDDPSHVEDSSPIQEYEPRFGVAAIEERRVGSNVFVRTPSGRFIDRASLSPARISPFHGEEISETGTSGAPLTIAFVRAAGLSSDKTKVRLGRREAVRVGAPETLGKAALLRVTRATGDSALVREKDLVRPTLAAPPADLQRGERWIDVDLKTQTLVAYRGETAVFATLVSTGKGADGSETATPRGTFRIWVKLATSNMDNLEDEDLAEHFSLEDVPYVQFFQKGVAIHGAFWHDDFGAPRSHGCVNLSLADASWLFRFTAPHLPTGWSAALPSELERGTIVRVR